MAPFAARSRRFWIVVLPSLDIQIAVDQALPTSSAIVHCTYPTKVRISFRLSLIARMGCDRDQAGEDLLFSSPKHGQ